MANVLHRTTKEYIESANTPEYPESEWIINPDLSNVQGVPNKYWKITGDIVTEMSSTEKDAVFLDDAKETKKSQVDSRTGQLISQGFVYGGSVFSLSEVAQLNWVGLNHADVKAVISYPLAISTKDDGEYLLTSAVDVTQFFMTGVGVKKAHLDSGRDLKILISQAETLAELDAIVDNR